jgi:hypothetical protein
MLTIPDMQLLLANLVYYQGHVSKTMALAAVNCKLEVHVVGVSCLKGI